VLCNIIIEFGKPSKPVGLIKIYFNEIYRTVLVGKNLSGKFPIQNGLKEDVLSPLFSNFTLEYAIRRVQENHEGLKLNGTHRLLAYAEDANIVQGNTDTIKKSTETLSGASKNADLKANQGKTKYILMSHNQEIRA
jgi:hypothetical protein